MDIASKTRSVINRFPDFYKAGASETLFVQFVDVFGQMLEMVETDLITVMRAHWVDTAGNEGSRGFDTTPKGDLDKIFAFYLENLGGTSQLKQVNWRFVPQDFLNLPGLVDRLRHSPDPFSSFLRTQFSAETHRLLEEYQFVRGALVLERLTGDQPLEVPAQSRLALIRSGQRTEFETIEAIRLPYKVKSAAVTVQALNPGSRHEVTTIGGQRWRLESDDDRLASLIVYNLQPLYVQTEALGQALADDFNRLLEVPFYNRRRFGELSLAPELQELVKQAPQQGRMLARLNYALLEAAYPSLIRQSYTAYRERLKGVIQVLEEGASTVAGIRSIVAVNLGIVGADRAAVEAREKVRVVEFLPLQETSEVGRFLELGQPFEIDNPNPVEVNPTVRLRLSPNLPSPLTNLRLVNRTTGQFVQLPERLYRDDELVLMADGGGLLNGVRIEAGEIVGNILYLPLGRSIWHIEASADLSSGVFNQTAFDASIFENARLNDASLADWDEKRLFEDQPAITSVVVSLSRLTPGAFTVYIPWDIPGFTDKFAEYSDHPRHQIRYIIEKVKAAGVFTAITYEKLFTEIHEQQDRLLFAGNYPEEEAHSVEIADFAAKLRHTPEQAEDGIQHDMVESFAVSGVLDHTYFDQSLFWSYPAVTLDETRFDRAEFWSEAGVYDETKFDRSEFGTRPGFFDEEEYGHSQFDPVSGRLDTTEFERTVFLDEAGLFDQTRFDEAGLDLEPNPE